MEVLEWCCVVRVKPAGAAVEDLVEANRYSNRESRITKTNIRDKLKDLLGMT